MNGHLFFGKKISSPVGTLLVMADTKALVGIFWDSSSPAVKFLEETNDIIEATEKQLTEYFSGRRIHFDLPLSFQGTPFQAAVWHALQGIPFATTVSYAQLAQKTGNDKAVRAVGTAVGKNPIPIIIPCHRIIGTDGTLRGFGGGLPYKKILLDLEASV